MDINEIIKTVETKGVNKINRAEVFHLTKAGRLSVDEEGNFVLCAPPEPVVEEKPVISTDGKLSSKEKLEIMRPKVTEAINAVLSTRATTRVDEVWKHLGCPDKAAWRSSILAVIQEHVNAGRLVQHRKGDSNFGIFYTRA
jgi:hypothetical protein